MAYAPGLTEFLRRSAAIFPPDYHKRHSPPVQRQLYDQLVHEFPFDRPGGVQVQDDVVYADGRPIPVRVYRPADTDGGALLYMHGGGFVIGSLESHDTIVAELAQKSGLVVLAVDFRLAPEHPFPAAIEDCYGAWRGAVGAAGRLGIDASRLGVAGDSSGGNLATVICLMARDLSGPPVRAQVLISPVLDFARWRGGGDDAPLLTSDEMVFFTRCYAPDPALLEHPYVSPLRSASFHGMPPAYIMAAEEDSLRIDAEQYAEQLRQNGTAVELSVEPGLIHACVRARGLSPAVADAFDRLCNAARRLLAPPGAPGDA